MKNKFNNAIPSVVLLASWFLIFICTIPSLSQDLSSNEDGIKTINKGDLRITIDEFTGEITIGVSDLSKFSNLYGNERNNHQSLLMPLYNGEEDHLKDGFGFFDLLLGGDKNFLLILLNPKFNRNLADEEDLSAYFLVDGERNDKTAYHQKYEDQEQKKELLVIPFSKEEWVQVIESDTTKFRINKQVFFVDKNTKDLMAEIFKEYEAIKSNFNKRDETQETGIPKKDETKETNFPEKKKSAPYELKWEGDIERNPMVQPLPDNTTDAEATITVRFEVKPDGTVGRIVPLKQMNPELEREVMRTLRSWRFSRLPSGVPQQSQWGTITFRFVLE